MNGFVRRSTSLLAVTSILTTPVSSAACRRAFVSTAQDPALSAIPIRPVGRWRYALHIDERDANEVRSVRVRFEHEVRRDGSEYAHLASLDRSKGGAPFEPIELTTDCATQLSTGEGRLGSVRLSPTPSNLSELVPLCAPEEIFGAATDILTFISINSDTTFRVRELKAPGDERAIRGFVDTWRRPPALLDARIESRGGRVRMMAASRDSVIVEWDPGPMSIAMIRDLNNGTRGLVHGVERFAVAVTIDRATGVLRGGRSIRDSLTLNLVVPYREERVPLSRPSTVAGIPVTITRLLSLQSEK